MGWASATGTQTWALITLMKVAANDIVLASERRDLVLCHTQFSSALPPQLLVSRLQRVSKSVDAFETLHTLRSDRDLSILVLIITVSHEIVQYRLTNTGL